MTEIRIKPDGSTSVYALTDFNCGETVAIYGAVLFQAEEPQDTDMYLQLDDVYAVGNPDTSSKEHGQFISDSTQCSVDISEGDTIHDLSCDKILLIAEYLTKTINAQNVCNGSMYFYACRGIKAGEELHISYGTTYWLKNDLIDACIEALIESQYIDEFNKARSEGNVIAAYKIYKRGVMDFVDMLISREYIEFYRADLSSEEPAIESVAIGDNADEEPI
jgi:hypothetical protein